MPAAQVKEKPMQGGYPSTTSSEAYDDHWETDKGGKKMQFNADPKVGLITSDKIYD